MTFWRNKTPAGEPGEKQPGASAATEKEELVSPGESGKAAEEALPTPPGEAQAPVAKRATKRRRALRQTLPAVAAVVLYAVFAFFMFANSAAAVRPGTVLSLRYETPLTAAQVAAAKHTAGNPDLELPFSAAYWYQSDNESLTSTRGTVEKVSALFVDGDMETVLRVPFLYGSYPAALEKQGLALSEELAWQLLGGINVVGAEITWHGQTYTVRGVFKGSELMALAQIDAAESPIENFSGVELAGTPEGDPRTAAESYLQQVGLGTPGTMVNTRTVPGYIGAMAFGPALVLLVWFAVRLLKMLHHVTYWKRKLVWFALLLAVAILIPRALAALPGWVIPNQWSNLEHWSTFLKELNARLTELLALRPYYWDIELKKKLILQAVLLVPALFAMVEVIRRWGAYMRRADRALRAEAARYKPEGPAVEEAEEADDGEEDNLPQKMLQKEEKEPRSL
ncbi:MAG: ABC transporter permease [Oscillospiraceae bacterium]